MQKKAPEKAPTPRRVVELTKSERKEMAKALAEYGSLQEMIDATKLKSDTIRRVKISGKGLSETIEAIRGYLLTLREAANVHAGAA